VLLIAARSVWAFALELLELLELKNKRINQIASVGNETGVDRIVYLDIEIIG
jgi:hypothetical protein